MADRVQRMMENQKKREEAMREKEAAAAAEEQAKRQAALAAATPKQSASIGASSSTPAKMENNFTMKKALFAPLPSVARGKPTLMGGDPNGENILYTVGNDVIIRSLRDPLAADMYIEHPRPTTVARYSPNGQMIASADQTGTVRIWHVPVINGTVHKLFFEKRSLGGAVYDMAWDPEGKRIVAVGMGREVMGDVFDAETGSSRGQITGHSKTITSCDWRPSKPYKIVTGSEDLGLCWFDGPPFKWQKTLTVHSRFVNCVRFSPDGSLFASVGQDKLGFIFDGETADQKLQLQEDHQGGIYCCSWSPNGSQLLTASGDKTCRIFDVNSGRSSTVFEFGDSVDDQQVGCLWQGEYLVSLSLSGHLSYLDPRSPGKPVKVLKGHNKSIESLAYHKESNTLYTGSYDSIVCRWDESSGAVDQVGGDGHKNSVVSLRVQGDSVWSCSLDDTIRVTPHDSDFTGENARSGGKPFDLAVASEPGLAVSGNFEKEILVLRDGQVASRKKVDYTPQAFAFSPDSSEIAVGGDDKKVHLYRLSGNTLQEGSVLTEHRDAVTVVRYSPDGQYLASGDKTKNIVLWKNGQVQCRDWVYHTAKINSMAWSPDSKHLASVSLDTSIIIWSVDQPTKRVTIKSAHHGGLNAVEWLDNSTLATAGQDSALRTWNISFD